MCTYLIVLTNHKFRPWAFLELVKANLGGITGVMTKKLLGFLNTFPVYKAPFKKSSVNLQSLVFPLTPPIGSLPTVHNVLRSFRQGELVHFEDHLKKYFVIVIRSSFCCLLSQNQNGCGRIHRNKYNIMRIIYCEEI